MLELWVETKSDDGKFYFYNACTRETTWTKPEGPNVKIISQSEIEAMNQNQMMLGPNHMVEPQQTMPNQQAECKNGILGFFYMCLTSGIQYTEIYNKPM